MIRYKHMLALVATLLITLTGFAQEQQATVEMATGLYQSGKIYVVVIVMAIVFVGIAAYLVILDRKISKLEEK